MPWGRRSDRTLTFNPIHGHHQIRLVPPVGGGLGTQLVVFEEKSAQPSSTDLVFIVGKGSTGYKKTTNGIGRGMAMPARDYPDNFSMARSIKEEEFSGLVLWWAVAVSVFGDSDFIGNSDYFQQMMEAQNLITALARSFGGNTSGL